MGGVVAVEGLIFWSGENDESVRGVFVLFRKEDVLQMEQGFV